MNELHLFAGAGGGILGGILVGNTCVCAVENNEHRRRILLQRQRDGVLPMFPIWDDIKTFRGSEWRGKVDVVSGGFPCQRFSSASRGRQVAEDLWPEMLRVVAESEPTFVFAENVSRAAIEIAAEDLRALGYLAKATSVAASDVGADHIRKRYWLLAYPNHEKQLLKRLNAKMEGLPNVQTRVWESNPNEPRVADGLADRVDRFEAIGNGQVPAVVAFAWRVLMRQLP